MMHAFHSVSWSISLATHEQHIRPYQRCKFTRECFEAQISCPSLQAGGGIRPSPLLKIRNWGIIIVWRGLYRPCTCCPGLIGSFAVFFHDWNLTETAARLYCKGKAVMREDTWNS
jgi:hypothetical protein